MMRLVLSTLGAAACLASAPPALAQPDLSGFWNLAFDARPDPDLIDRLPDETVVIEDTGVVEFPENEFGGLILKPETSARAAEWRPDDEMALSRVCLPPSIIYAIQGPFPFELHQTTDLIALKYEYFDQVRLVFMDGRDHPPADAPHSKMGFSTGRWDGDDLVIETSHIAPSTITNNGLDHSENIRMVERYRLSEDGTRLRATQWFSDRSVLDNDGARYIEWEKRAGEYVYPYECDPSFALEYQQAGAEQTAP